MITKADLLVLDKVEFQKIFLSWKGWEEGKLELDGDDFIEALLQRPDYSAQECLNFWLNSPDDMILDDFATRVIRVKFASQGLTTKEILEFFENNTVHSHDIWYIFEECLELPEGSTSAGVLHWLRQENCSPYGEGLGSLIKLMKLDPALS